MIIFNSEKGENKGIKRGKITEMYMIFNEHIRTYENKKSTIGYLV